MGATHQNEQAYDLLCLGTSVPQTVEGDTKSLRRGSDQANQLILFVMCLKTGVDLALYRPFYRQKEQYTQAH